MFITREPHTWHGSSNDDLSITQMSHFYLNLCLCFHVALCGGKPCKRYSTLYKIKLWAQKRPKEKEWRQRTAHFSCLVSHKKEENRSKIKWKIHKALRDDKAENVLWGCSRLRAVERLWRAHKRKLKKLIHRLRLNINKDFEVQGL